jgi:hypothetical protein
MIPSLPLRVLTQTYFSNFREAHSRQNSYPASHGFLKGEPQNDY